MSRQFATNVTTIYDIFCPVPFLPSPFGFRRFIFRTAETTILIKSAFWRGSGRGKIVPDAVFLGKFHDNGKIRKFYCQKFCCHFGCSYLNVHQVVRQYQTDVRPASNVLEAISRLQSPTLNIWELIWGLPMPTSLGTIQQCRILS